jgi:hypothetical protein
MRTVTTLARTAHLRTGGHPKMHHETAEKLRNRHVPAIRKMEQHPHRNPDGPISVNATPKGGM